MDGFLQLGVIRGQLRPVFDKLIDMDQRRCLNRGWP